MQSYTYGLTPPEVIRKALGDKPYEMTLAGEDIEVMTEAVNQGIDSHLEAVTDSSFDWEDNKLADGRIIGRKLKCSVSPDSMMVILRRLLESDSDAAMSLRSSILTTLEIEEV